MERQRRYRVSGVDEFGDLYTVETDDKARADDTHAHFAEDLNAVAIEDRSEG